MVFVLIARCFCIVTKIPHVFVLMKQKQMFQRHITHEMKVMDQYFY